MTKSPTLRYRRPFITTLLILFSLLAGTIARADEPTATGMVFGAQLGIARVNLDNNPVSNGGSWLFGSLSADYLLSGELAVGLEAAGWTDQATNSTISEDVLGVFMILKYRPAQLSGLAFKLGGGYAKHRLWNSPAAADSSGDIAVVGVGIGEGVKLDLDYRRGDLERTRYEALTLSLGVSF